jgi:hypothetical protein
MAYGLILDIFHLLLEMKYTKNRCKWQELYVTVFMAACTKVPGNERQVNADGCLMDMGLVERASELKCPVIVSTIIAIFCDSNRRAGNVHSAHDQMAAEGVAFPRAAVGHHVTVAAAEPTPQRSAYIPSAEVYAAPDAAGREAMPVSEDRWLNQ